MTTKTLDFTNHELAFSGAQETMLQLMTDQILAVVDTTITAHVDDTTAAHASTAISLSSTLYSGQTTVKAGLEHIAGTGRTTETVKANADAITAVKGVGWSAANTVKGNTDAIVKLNGMYSIEFVGADADPDAAFCGSISVLTPGAVPAAGDKIIAILSARVTADMSPAAYPAIVAAATSDGFVQVLELDGATVKVKQGAGSDLDANTYRALVLRV